MNLLPWMRLLSLFRFCFPCRVMDPVGYLLRQLGNRNGLNAHTLI